MTKFLSSDGLEINQKNFQQILIRSDGREQFNDLINKEISLPPPSKNLEIVNNEKYLFAKNSFDQWSLLYLKEQNYQNTLKFISILNER